MAYSEYQNGARNARDNILAMLIGLQNGLDTDSEKYQVLQEVYEEIVKTHGDMMKEYKQFLLNRKGDKND